MQRIVVTGIGVITSIGVGRKALWEGLHEDRVGISKISRFDVSDLHCQIAGVVQDFDAEQWIPAPAVSGLDRYARFCAAAAKMAVEDSGLDLDGEHRERVGCYIGSALGGVSFGEIQFEKYHTQKRLAAMDPSVALAFCGAEGPSQVSIQLGVNGPASSNADSCAAGPIAIARAADAIRRGIADVMLAGAAETPLTRLSFGSFDRIRAMSTHYNDTPELSCRPFDRGRDGFVMGEGAALLVLESEEHARRRGAECLAEVAGFGLTNDGHHMTAPRSDGSQACRAMRLALDDAGCAPGDLDAVSAHGSSTPLNDVAESQAIRDALGDRAYQIPVIATKSRHAHSLGATGAIEAAICAMGLYHGWLPGALNLEDPDSGCDLDYARSGPVAAPFRTILSNSFGFGGINACLVMRAADRAA
ncbi:MAG: beta-ketoacyl-ACP synthase II [Chloroflexi bacterium]|nr:beta-ketoacyl-ACP synthase II [Chloroflexota bacterium]